MVGFRLHPDDDKDIAEDLGRFKNKSKRIRAMYRKGLATEVNNYPNTGQAYLGKSLVEQSRESLANFGKSIEIVERKPLNSGLRNMGQGLYTAEKVHQPIAWDKPSVKPIEKVPVKVNILKNNF